MERIRTDTLHSLFYDYPSKSVGRFPSGSAYDAEGCQIYISFVSFRQAEASSRRVLHDTMGQMDAMV